MDHSCHSNAPHIPASVPVLLVSLSCLMRQWLQFSKAANACSSDLPVRLLIGGQRWPRVKYMNYDELLTRVRTVGKRLYIWPLSRRRPRRVARPGVDQLVTKFPGYESGQPSSEPPGGHSILFASDCFLVSASTILRSEKRSLGDFDRHRLRCDLRWACP